MYFCTLHKPLFVYVLYLCTTWNAEVKAHFLPIAVTGIVPWGDRFSEKAKGVSECLEWQSEDHNVEFISHKNIIIISLIKVEKFFSI